MTKKPAGHPRFHELIQSIAELHDKKNTDYAGGGEAGLLGNFTRVSGIKRLYPGFDWATPFGVAMGYMLKQLDAAFFLEEQQKESITGEPIAARLTDVAVYSLIGIVLKEETD